MAGHASENRGIMTTEVNKIESESVLVVLKVQVFLYSHMIFQMLYWTNQFRQKHDFSMLSLKCKLDFQMFYSAFDESANTQSQKSWERSHLCQADEVKNLWSWSEKLRQKYWCNPTASYFKRISYCTSYCIIFQEDEKCKYDESP